MIPKQRIKVERSYSSALGEEIIELIKRTQDNKLLYSEILDMLGDHDSIRLKVDELLYNNEILKVPVELGNVKDFLLTIPKKVQTAWDTMTVCSCFTCSRIHECGINNPVNLITCKALNEWMLETSGLSDKEIEKLKFKFEDFDLIEEEDEIELLKARQ